MEDTPEATLKINANTQALIWQAVLNYTRTHQVGLLVISHESALLKRLCDRIINVADYHTNQASEISVLTH